MDIVLSVFFIRLLFLFLLSFVSEFIIPYFGNFANPQLLEQSGLPKFVYTFANFDGAHYINIAREGYHQFDQVFFPLYPFFMRLVAPLFGGNYLVAGLMISNGAFLAGLCLLYKLIEYIYSRATAIWASLFLLAFPTSFFLNGVYTEGLYFFLIAAALYIFFVKKKNYFLFTAALSSAARFSGFLLFIPFTIHVLKKEKEKYFKLILSLVAPFIGLFVYMFFLQKTTGDGLMFFHAQSAVNLNRSTHLIFLPQVYFRYFKILLFSHFDLVYFVSLFEVAMFTIIGVVSTIHLFRSYKRKNWFGVGMGVFSICNLLPPTLTGTFLSIPRFALFSWSFFLFMAEIKEPSKKIVFLTIFFLWQSFIAALFFTGHFVS